MGEASRRKWENRIERAKQSIHAVMFPASDSRGSLSWIARSGVAAILLGGLGLMQTFFWPSIIAVYVGVLLLLVDLWNHRSSRAFKIAVSGAMSIGLVLFSIFVVFRREPIRVSYAISQDGTVNAYVVNPTADDYRELDVHIQLPRGQIIVKHSQRSELATCSLFGASDGAALQGEQMHILTMNTPSGPSQTQFFGNFQRVRCEVLPSHATLWLKLVPAQGNTLSDVGTVDRVRVVYTYKGKFREFSLNEEAGVQDLNLHSGG